MANIAARPATVNDCSEPAHWEADHIINQGNSSALMCLTQRVSRYSMLITMPNGYTAADACEGLAEGIEQIPLHLRRSITFDQGSKCALWPQLLDTFNMAVWFYDPHSPW
jgi:IS30 family transposase